MNKGHAIDYAAAVYSAYWKQVEMRGEVNNYKVPAWGSILGFSDGLNVALTNPELAAKFLRTYQAEFAEATGADPGQVELLTSHLLEAMAEAMKPRA